MAFGDKGQFQKLLVGILKRLPLAGRNWKFSAGKFDHSLILRCLIN